MVLISCVAWGAGAFEHDTLRTVRPVQLFFSTYAEDALVKVRRLRLTADPQTTFGHQPGQHCWVKVCVCRGSWPKCIWRARGHVPWQLAVPAAPAAAPAPPPQAHGLPTHLHSGPSLMKDLGGKQKCIAVEFLSNPDAALPFNSDDYRVLPADFGGAGPCRCGATGVRKISVHICAHFRKSVKEARGPPGGAKSELLTCASNTQ